MQPSFNEFTVGTAYVIHLPTVDRAYTNQHNLDKPFMLYPGEVSVDYTSPMGKTYVITNYGRVWSNSKKDFTKSVTGCYLPTLIKQLFDADALDNEYTAYNIQLLSPAKYYQQHKEERLAYQKKYRAEHLEQCTASEKEYRQKNRDKINERSRTYRANKRNQLNELKDTDPDKYAEIKEAERVKRHEAYLRRKARLNQQSLAPVNEEEEEDKHTDNEEEEL